MGSATELEDDALPQIASGSFGEPAARRGRPGEVDASHLGVLDELIPDRGRLARGVRDDVEHAGWKSRLGEDLAPHKPAAVGGDSSDGLSTTVLPKTSGAQIDRAERMSAAFQGAIAPTTPTGLRIAIAVAPGRSLGRIWPSGAYAAPAAWRKRPGTKPIWNMPHPNCTRSREQASRPPRRGETSSTCAASRKMA